MNMPNIGIVGITIPGALDCINHIHRISAMRFKQHRHPGIALMQGNFEIIHKAQNQGKWEVVSGEIIKEVNKLELAGADMIIIPANTVHKVIDQIQAATDLPVISILEAVAQHCAEKQLKRVAVMGTRWTMADHLYREPLQQKGINEITVDPKEQTIIQEAIFEELVPQGQASEETTNALLRIISELQKKQRCDGVILGCTELPLVLNEANSVIPPVDSTQILAEASIKAVERLLAGLHLDKKLSSPPGPSTER